MAEIRSTLDMVMERAARMAAETPDTSSTEDSTREKGMRLAVAYLNGEQSDLLKTLQEQPAADQMEIRSGMAKTLLRNIILPRGGTISEQSRLSLKGLPAIAGKSADIVNLCTELQQILEQYSQHKEQVKQQFDESILGQLKMRLHQQGVAVTEDMALNPAMHPQYQEEWNRVQTDLNSQYDQAIEQRRRQISQRFGL